MDNNELPLGDIIFDDPRVGRLVKTHRGLTGKIEYILPWTDGTEMLSVQGDDGNGQGGLTEDQVTYLDEEK